ncbi:MAG TPA: hypothetical protein VG737_12565 [Cyclobacteriaceae bacterium]|nr:hypothetical protein [Cyclobacteriaceae bacterium]
MKSKEFADMLRGGDLRALHGAADLAGQIRSQRDFDALFTLLFHHDRAIVMRAADAVEKISRHSPEFLAPHCGQILELMMDHANIELKWHLAQIAPRLELSVEWQRKVWARLRYWLLNRNESKIVRVNALQGMFDLMRKYQSHSRNDEFRNVVASVSREHIPSIDARVRKLRRMVAEARTRQKEDPVQR